MTLSPNNESTSITNIHKVDDLRHSTETQFSFAKLTAYGSKRIQIRSCIHLMGVKWVCELCNIVGRCPLFVWFKFMSAINMTPIRAIYGL